MRVKAAYEHTPAGAVCGCWDRVPENVPLGLNFPILTVSLCEIKEGNYRPSVE